MPAPSARLALGDITDKNVNLLRRLNSAVFPVKYNDQFYNDLLGTPSLTKLAFYGDILVGAVCCRVEEDHKLYIMTLGVLAPYRRLGVGKLMMDHVLADMIKCQKDVNQVYVHVQVNNDGAIAFYKQFGFENTGTIENYYKRITPNNCYILTKKLSSIEPDIKG